MKYADIKQYDVADGPGVRVSLFVSGCTHHCKECFNPETWDFQYGKPFTEETVKEILEYLKPEYVGLLPLLKKVRKKYPGKSIWCFTGYDFERDVQGRMMGEWEETAELLSYIDVLVDGEFQIEKKDLGLAFKGSSNQRTILVQESLKKERVIEIGGGAAGEGGME